MNPVIYDIIKTSMLSMQVTTMDWLYILGGSFLIIVILCVIGVLQKK